MIEEIRSTNEKLILRIWDKKMGLDDGIGRCCIYCNMLWNDHLVDSRRDGSWDSIEILMVHLHSCISSIVLVSALAFAWLMTLVINC